MSYESIKSLVLTIAVLASILLTWGLWTYHPEYETIENANIVDNVPISNTKDLASLIKPTKILFHTNGKHYGTIDETEINTILKEVKKWEISDFNNISSTLSTNDFSAFLQKSGHVEIQFIDEIPLSIYRAIFNVSEQELPTMTFDRVIINLNETDEYGSLYFVSVEEQMVYEAKAYTDSIEGLEEIYAQSNEYPEYFTYSVSETKSIFLPVNSTSMNSVQYYTDYLDAERFKDALFIDPSIVKKHILTYGEEYTDGSRLLRVSTKKDSFQYINLVNSTTTDTMGKADLITSSIEFINEHGGWTDKYRYFMTNKFEQRTVFQLYINNYPVFNKSGLTEIHQIWNQNEVSKYQRPLLVLEIPIPSTKVELPSGERVIQEITSQEGFEPALLDEVILGYELVENQEKTNVATLEPIWSYHYDGRWRKLELLQGTGGNKGGLE
ncbi:YycH family regulatory protein [Litchfieldia salsa]|uniref:Two-component signal transduction system YycFG, regulatory protein YycH n=1 Tax=Litchfieldia salsa TaxID=930152 RepID=A0A1H0UE69_9BACI|nr:two-component system activity regulator YycH [Litchfieldia salsa]SDP64288.1 Two-component signal transduction system YycFG, regulatory protein YycH [Litchfieldia salsa]